MDNSLLVIECQYFPTISYFKLLDQFTYVEIEQWESYKKGGYRNRATIIGSNGPIELIIPLAGGREQKKLVKDIEVDNTTNWKTIHSRSIKSSYSNSPFYEYYAKQVYKLINADISNLVEFNIQILEWLLNTLKINISIGLTPEFKREVPCLDARNIFTPTTLPLDDQNFQPRYYQVFEDRQGFKSNLSILDLLFCEGPNASNLIRGFNRIGVRS
jgi:hypothetical protein